MTAHMLGKSSDGTKDLLVLRIVRPELESVALRDHHSDFENVNRIEAQPFTVELCVSSQIINVHIRQSERIDDSLGDLAFQFIHVVSSTDAPCGTQCFHVRRAWLVHQLTLDCLIQVLHPPVVVAVYGVPMFIKVYT